MKTKKKHVGTKAEIRAQRDRERRIVTTIFLVFILLIVIFSSYFAYNFLNQSKNQTIIPESFQPKVAIVDQLSQTFPNQSFIETINSTLTQAGYTVDYYSGERVTVDFFRSLPTCGYSIIILRAHSSASTFDGTKLVKTPVVFFTSETYSTTKYVNEQLNDQITRVSYTVPDPPYYFGLLPRFVTSSMRGRFYNTLVVMMGCEGLSNSKMAEAWIAKGAKAYIGWNNEVSAAHTDMTAAQLLKHLVTERQTIKQAVEDTLEEAGPDPVYNSLLKYYPFDAGDQTMESLRGGY